MSYVGNAASPQALSYLQVSSQAFDGDGSTTGFTLNRYVSAAKDIEVVVNNVQQSPYDGSYSVSGTTLTFSEAPSSGTDNIYVTYRDYPIGTVIPASSSVGSSQLQSDLSLTGDLNLASTGARITGDFSNATVADRVAFQTSTVNGNTILTIIPNGTGTATGFTASNNSDPTNASLLSLNSLSTEARILATIAGTGTFLPLTIYTNGSEKMRLTTDGYLRMASGTGGIQFNGDTAAANALDDYEEGTFTCTIGYSTNINATSADATTTATGDYVKVGKFVQVNFPYIDRASTFGGTSVIVFYMTVPFTVGGSTGPGTLMGNYNLTARYTSTTFSSWISYGQVNSGTNQMQIGSTTYNQAGGGYITLENASANMRWGCVYIASS